jgi:PAS domain S-box-containing protein
MLRPDASFIYIGTAGLQKYACLLQSRIKAGILCSRTSLFLYPDSSTRHAGIKTGIIAKIHNLGYVKSRSQPDPVLMFLSGRYPLKLRTRVITVILTSTICICAILFVALNWIFSRNYSQLETDQMKQDLDRIQTAIENEEITLNKQSASWASWDNTYSFTKDGNPDYILNNFTDKTFIREEVNLCAVINSSGDIVYAGLFDLDKNQHLPVSAETRQALSESFLFSRDTGKGKIGLLQTDKGPLLIGTSPILTSKGEGPLLGTFIAGRYLDQRLINKINFITKFTITASPLTDFPLNNGPVSVPSLSPQDPVFIQPLDSHTLTGYKLMPDIYGQPYLVIGTQTPRDLYSQGMETMILLYACLSLVAVLLVVITILLIDNTILARLRVLSNFAAGVSREGDFTARVSLHGQDELKALGDEVNAMLNRLSLANEELLESENKYSTLVEKSSDGIILILNELVFYANPRILQMLGTEKEDFIGSRLSSFVTPQYQDKVTSQYKNRINGKPAEDSYEIEIKHKDGISIPVEISARLIKLNRQDCVMVVLRDITEHKKAEKAQEALLQKEKSMRENLEEEARARSQFINVLAHELRTPLTPVLASLEMARDSLASDPSRVQYKLVKNAMDGAENLRMRLEELLDMARFSRGVFTLNPVEIDTGEFLKTVALRYSPTLKNKAQELIIGLPVDLPKITADPSRLEQVIVNLLSNAGKYSPGQTRITLQASAVPEGILVEVKDQGIGIPPQEINDLFTPYHRVSETAQKYSGIGLGLAVCKQIIEAHKGRIWVESELGKGSTFKFILPLKPPPEQK